jgi:hypothetical protein
MALYLKYFFLGHWRLIDVVIVASIIRLNSQTNSSFPSFHVFLFPFLYLLTFLSVALSLTVFLIDSFRFGSYNAKKGTTASPALGTAATFQLYFVHASLSILYSTDSHDLSFSQAYQGV